jgi:uncharacterized Zn-finger protein
MRFKLTQKQHFLFGALGMAFTIASIVLVYELDMLVHGLLYEYGLVFDYAWASPYWAIQRTLLVTLAVLFILSFIPTAFLAKTVILPLLERKHLQVTSTGGGQLQSAVSLENRGNKDEEAKSLRSSTSNQEAADAIHVSAVPMICNKCGKVFNQPLCMFDFRTGNPRLIHVCPYCNAVLAVAGSSTGK